MFDPIIQAERESYNQPASPGLPFDKQLLVYRETSGRALHATLYRPLEPAGQPWPAIVFVHGGGWSAGDRGQFARHSAHMAAHAGIAGLCIDYRLTTVAPYPACVQDARAAIRWIQDEAVRFNIDPARIAIGGSSAGSHIAALVATGGDLESDSEASTSAARFPLRAAVLCAGIYRLPADASDAVAAEAVIKLLGGTPDEVPARYAAASPLNHVSSRCPPTLLMHGDADRIISHRQSEAFATRLRAVGVHAEVELFEGANHGQLNDLAHLPRTMGRMTEFLKRHL